jgi:hypothetical protein
VRDGGVTTKRRILRYALDDQQHVMLLLLRGASSSWRIRHD